MRQDDISAARSRGPEERDLLRARDEVVNQLAKREIAVHDGDNPEMLVDLLEAVEDFERAVVAAGGDLMTNQIDTNQPDDPGFVLPRRGDDETAAGYERRVQQATRRLVDRR